MVITFPPVEAVSDRIRRPSAVTVVDDHFDDAVPVKQKEAADPLKDPADIMQVKEYLLTHERYRDHLLFIAGINLGFRCGDLLQLKVGHLLTEDGKAYREKIVVKEDKTGKVREAYLNDAVCDAADLYFAHEGEVSLNDYLFKSNCNRVKAMGTPMTVRSVERLLKDVVNDQCGIPIHASTHMLRKTFAYHTLINAPDRSRAIEFLMKVLGHSSPSITLDYAGLTKEEIRASYQGLNLGLGNTTYWQLRRDLVG